MWVSGSGNREFGFSPGRAIVWGLWHRRWEEGKLTAFKGNTLKRLDAKMADEPLALLGSEEVPESLMSLEDGASWSLRLSWLIRRCWTVYPASPEELLAWRRVGRAVSMWHLRCCSCVTNHGRLHSQCNPPPLWAGTCVETDCKYAD